MRHHTTLIRSRFRILNFYHLRRGLNNFIPFLFNASTLLKVTHQRLRMRINRPMILRRVRRRYRRAIRFNKRLFANTMSIHVILNRPTNTHRSLGRTKFLMTMSNPRLRRSRQRFPMKPTTNQVSRIIRQTIRQFRMMLHIIRIRQQVRTLNMPIRIPKLLRRYHLNRI